MLKELSDFHTLHGYPRFRNVSEERSRNLDGADGMILGALTTLKLLSNSLRDDSAKMMVQGDCRAYRIHLMAEELGEVCEALKDGDKLSLAHELTDLLYTVVGSFDTFGLPMEELFAEVHRANMTKRKKKDDIRMRDKGDAYVPPNIAGVLNGTVTAA